MVNTYKCIDTTVEQKSQGAAKKNKVIKKKHVGEIQEFIMDLQ